MKHKKLKIALIASVAAVFILIASLSVYAFFTTRVYVYTDTGKEVAQVGMNLQLLFGKLEGVQQGTDLKIPNYTVVAADGTVVTATTATGETYPATIPTGDGQYLRYNDGVSTGQTTTYDPNAPWGTAQNPYIISEARHLQNLSALQSVGYFDLLYIANNFADDGSYISGGASIPYFLICNVDGSPVTIDGTDLGTIKPIGSAEHPFIGVIGGAFTTTKTDTNGTTTLTTPVGADKTSEVSAIHGFKIQTNTNQVDVGLFGYVGYLGTEPTENVTTDSTFSGVVSVVQNLLLSDVQVVVNNPSVAEVVSELLGHVFNSHKYTFTGQADATPGTPPHEDHHIGIFAGHVSYAHANYISVYYSDDENVAIDLTHTGTNYHSSTGIVGFMHNMNSPVKNQTNGHCQISYGGISSSGINMTPDSEGSGGGKGVGVGRGYVVAKTLYEVCHYIETNQTMGGDRVWMYRLSASGAWNYAGMFFQVPGSDPATYVDVYGNAATVNDNAKTVTANGTVYTKYILRNIKTGDSSNTYKYVDVLYDGTVIWDQTVEDAKAKENQKIAESSRCKEVSQTVWQFAFAKPQNANVPTWVDALMVYETQKGSGSYTLEDKVTPVTLGSTNADGTYTATLNIESVYQDTTKKVTISRVIFYRLQTDGSYVCSLTPTGDTINAPYAYREKPLLIRNARNMFGVELCVESTAGLSLGSGEMGNFYFYDGVFTFALSSPNDTIEPTWGNDTPDSIVIGPDDDSEWEAVPHENYAVVAFLKKITTVDELKDAAGKDIFIGYYQPKTQDVNNWYEGSLSVMSLADTVDPTGSLIEFTNDYVTTEANTKKFLSQTELQELIEALRDDPANATLLKNINNMQVLNLQSAGDLDYLQKKFRITPTFSGDDFTFAGVTSGYKLGLLNKKGRLSGTNHLSIWCGAGSPSNTILYTYSFDTTANIIEGTTAGTFRIQYNVSNTDRFVNFGSGNPPVFNGVGTAQATSDLCFYVVEEMATVPMGYVDFAPVSDASTKLSFDADKYILWPKTIMTKDGTQVVPTNSLTAGAAQTGTGYHDTEDIVTNGSGNTVDLFRTYKLVSLDQLVSGDNGWRDGMGSPLSYKSLRQKFTMQNAINFSISLKIPNIPNIQVNNNSVLAPVGPNGLMANIPTGSIAFRISDQVQGDQSIRVIVSVPVSQFYDGEEDALVTNVDYYLGLWKTEDLTDDGTSLNMFSQTTAEMKFELPRSRPYKPGTDAADADYILVEYLPEGQEKYVTYRCYLNGDRVLVGYEFVVSEPGTYILGTAAGSAPILGLFGEDTTENYPMEIVYCAVDGTASAGLDGTIGSVTGSLDYVYANNNKIVHVQDYAPGTGPTSGTKDYNYYYNSHIITHTVNDTSAINVLKFSPYRYVASDGVHFSLLASNPSLMNGKHLGVETDILTEGTLTSSGGG